MPFVEGIFFEIHGNKLKPDPAKVASQAAKICKSHRAFFLSRLRTHSLSFICGAIKLAKRRCVSVVFYKFEIVRPNVFLNGFDAVFAFGTFEY